MAPERSAFGAEEIDSAYWALCSIRDIGQGATGYSEEHGEIHSPEQAVEPVHRPGLAVVDEPH